MVKAAEHASQLKKQPTLASFQSAYLDKIFENVSTPRASQRRDNTKLRFNLAKCIAPQQVKPAVESHILARVRLVLSPLMSYW